MNDKPLSRLFPALTGREDEDVIITLHPSGFISFRPKRIKKEYTLPLTTCFRLAIEAEVRSRKRKV
jgi:hypothetical protein